MNGIHDMGGMQGMGPIVEEPDAAVFHHEWEGRVWGALLSLAPWGRGRRGWRNFRFELESIPAAEYLRMSYYERLFTMMVNRLLRSDLVSQPELDSGRADPTRPKPVLLEAPPLPKGAPSGAGRLDVRVSARFRLGQRVRARNIHPAGHTRLPRYTRGKRGKVTGDHGVFALQDTDGYGESLGGKPQHVYTVEFAARELWGDQASPLDTVSLDLWEDYLERAWNTRRARPL